MELFGLTDIEKNFVYLSDGGHFENLGIYEMLRRRCRTIVAVDGPAIKIRIWRPWQCDPQSPDRFWGGGLFLPSTPLLTASLRA
jgi:hypothetical protein